LREPELARRLGVEGRRHCLERFTLATTVAKLEQLISTMPLRAEERYRLHVGIARAVALPFRLLPVMLALYVAMHKHGFSLKRFAVQRTRQLWQQAPSRIYRLIRPART